MNILINDHAGHPFQIQLSRHLAFKGYRVLHSFTDSLQTPRGALKPQSNDPKDFLISPIQLSKPFKRYGLIQRYFQEKQLGKLLAETAKNFDSNAIFSANTPLGSQAMLLDYCRKNGPAFIFWLQDLLGIGIRNNLKKKIPLLGDLIGSYYIQVEQKLLKKSQAVVVITEDFVPLCLKAGVKQENIHVIHNWAPLQDVPVMEKRNPWSVAHSLDKFFNFIYSGTLGMKHNPSILSELAFRMKRFENVRIVVITEGLGAVYLEEQKHKHNLKNLVLLPFQPFEKIPQVQASADVLLAILEPDAGVFAVPSKVLTYLCSKRALLLSVPLENLAARTVKDNNAGIVVSPHDQKGFYQAALKLFENDNLRSEMASNGRKYAEAKFDIDRITKQFESIILSVCH